MGIRTAAAWCAAMVALGCGSSDDEGTKTCSVQPLDPAGTHYGKSYAGWAEAWMKWAFETQPTAQCVDPVGDATGEDCGFGQDPSASVFFLAGTWGGHAKRTKCSVSSSQAVFFPVVNTWWDNAGVPEPQWLLPEQLKQKAEETMSSAKDVSLNVDGCSESGIQAHLVSAPYTVNIPAEPNAYSCVQGQTGVTGPYEGWTSGYYVLLPPLSAGDHKIEFSATLVFDDADFLVDISYDPLSVKQ